MSTCEVLLAVIGPQWIDATGQDGQRRLEDPDDIVRLEIAAALDRGIRVIPILVEGAVMPDRQHLPEDLVKLARRNALSLRHESFRSDADRLLAAIQPILRPPAAGAPAASGPAQVVSGAVVPTDVVPRPGRALVLQHDGEVMAVAFSPDGRLLATASADKTARVWDWGTGQERARRVTHGGFQGVAFSHDIRLLATASRNGTARVWDWASGQERTRVTHGKWVWGVAFSPDGRLLATASADKTAWSLFTIQPS